MADTMTVVIHFQVLTGMLAKTGAVEIVNDSSTSWFHK